MGCLVYEEEQMDEKGRWGKTPKWGGGQTTKPERQGKKKKNCVPWAQVTKKKKTHRVKGNCNGRGKDGWNKNQKIEV